MDKTTNTKQSQMLNDRVHVFVCATKAETNKKERKNQIDRNEMNIYVHKSHIWSVQAVARKRTTTVHARIGILHTHTYSRTHKYIRKNTLISSEPYTNGMHHSQLSFSVLYALQRTILALSNLTKSSR